MQTKTFSVVLIDDDPDTRSIFEIMLNHQGVEVTTFDSPPTALPYLNEHKPDVIVIDLILTNMSGYEALAQVRELCPRARIMATTSQRMHGTINELLERGFDGYLPKPIDTKNLLRLLTNTVDQ